MSSIIVRRSRWSEIESEEFTYNNYAHVFRILSILQLGGGSLRYIKEEMVLFRGDNDSFLDKGYVNRILIDLDGYKQLGEYFFNEVIIRRAFKGVVRREHPFYYLPRLKGKVKNDLNWRKIEQKLNYYEYSPLEIYIINILGSSNVVIKTARYIKRVLGL
jgi:hypothetical protein